MAKFKRLTVGDIVKGKDGKPDYIKISNDVVLKRGDFLNLESKASQTKSIETAVKDGKMSEEIATSVMERVNKIPEFVRFQIVKLEKQE